MATDAELLALAEQATPSGASPIGAAPPPPLNGGEYGNPIPPQPGAGPGAMGLDLSSITGTVNPTLTPNGSPVAGPTEMPGDRTLPPVALPPTGPTSQIVAPPALNGPPSMTQAGQALPLQRPDPPAAPGARQLADEGGLRHVIEYSPR